MELIRPQKIQNRNFNILPWEVWTSVCAHTHKRSQSRYTVLFYKDVQPWPRDFRHNAATTEIVGIFFCWLCWEKVLFPWWSSPQPYILSKVMQLRLLLRRKYSFCLPCYHILRTRTRAAAAPALSSAISRPRRALGCLRITHCRSSCFPHCSAEHL